MSLRLANAPVSYGVFGDLTVEGATTPAALLRTMAAAGYDGSELGPPRFFGELADIRAAFDAAGIAAVGAYIPLHTQDTGATLERDLERMRLTLDELELMGGLAILADEGSDTLLAHPRHEAEYALDAAGWARLVEVVERARLMAADRGIATSFHPHIATYVERPGEIERLLDDTGIDLTYDVGHVVMGGGDAVADFERWTSRINHIHVKDVRLGVLEQAIASGRTDFDTWWADLCTPLGEGDLDLPGFLAAVVRSGYDGWLVVEHDRAPLTPEVVDEVLAAQRHNRSWLAGALAALGADTARPAETAQRGDPTPPATTPSDSTEPDAAHPAPSPTVP